MSQLATNQIPQANTLEQVLIQGDLAKLTPEQRTSYYMSVCQSVGLNHLTKPFDYIVLNNKLTLYAKRDCTDQLRKIHNVSIKISSRILEGDIYSVTALATDKTGRTDESVGAVCLGKSFGETKANLIMKAETKAKRRVTLSICGLGLLDETEVVDIPEIKNEIRGEVIPPQNSNAPSYANAPTGNTAGYNQRHDARMAEPMTEPQRKAIFAIAKNLGWDETQAKDWVLREFNIQSRTELTKSTASEAIKKLKDLEANSGSAS
jgi:hypothetical protein